MLQERIDRRLRGLAFLADQTRLGTLDTPEAFQLAAAATHNIATDFLAINRIGPDRRIVQVYPASNGPTALGQTVGQSPEVLALIERARDTNAPRATGMVTLFQGGRGVATYFPIWRADRFVGFINGVFRIDDLTRLLNNSNPNLPDDETITVFDLEAPPASGGANHAVRLSLLDRTLVVAFSHPRHDERLWTSAYVLIGAPLSIALALLTWLGLSMRTALHKRSAMLSTVLTAAPDAIVTLDKEFRVLVFNPAAEAMFGWTERQMLGRPIDSLIPVDSRDVHGLRTAEFADSHTLNREMGDWRTIKGLRANGQLFPIMISLSKIQFDNSLLITAVLRDMTQTKAIDERLIALAKDRITQANNATEANRAKTMFLATMSHEFRTPLNAIIGLSDMIKNGIFGPLGNAKYSEYVNDIHASGLYLLSIINTVLDLTKTEVGAYHYSSDRVSIEQLLREINAIAFPLTREKNLTFLKKSDGTDSFIGDFKATKQILLNLISNSIKFTKDSGYVTLTVKHDRGGDRIVFAVKDNGCGIAAANIEKIFNPYYQVGDPYHSEVNGTGLGLSISRAFARGMGGDIAIESEVGVGTTVTLSLPTGAPETPAATGPAAAEPLPQNADG